MSVHLNNVNDVTIWLC